MMTRNDRQEALSRAYVRAIAARAGVICSKPDQDYGVDFHLRSIRLVRETRRLDRGEQIDLQLKSTTQARIDETQVSFDLDVKTYNDLREPAGIPCLLVVIVLPEDEKEWLAQTVDELTLRRCAWWTSLVGMDETTAVRSVRISIPLTNVFSVPSVQNLFLELRERNRP